MKNKYLFQCKIIYIIHIDIYITLISLNGKAYIDIYNIQVDISSKLIREQG